ncbi:hypothetical protein GCM10009619_01430 [Williamsia maris]
MSHPNEFQLFQPIGGVAATPGIATAASSIWEPGAGAQATATHRAAPAAIALAVRDVLTGRECRQRPWQVSPRESVRSVY